MIVQHFNKEYLAGFCLNKLNKNKRIYASAWKFTSAKLQKRKCGCGCLKKILKVRKKININTKSWKNNYLKEKNQA